jgi:hypothetical protein
MLDEVWRMVLSFVRRVQRAGGDADGAALQTLPERLEPHSLQKPRRAKLDEANHFSCDSR